MASDNTQRKIVIVGGGIIGCTSAYFLTRHPLFNPSLHKITILEAQSIASGASGKAGGLLALWAYPSEIVPLSYKLHAQLAKEHDGAKRWGYRPVHAGHVDAIAKTRTPTIKDGVEVGGVVSGEREGEWQKLPKTVQKTMKNKIGVQIPEDLDWIDKGSITNYSEMGNPDTTAQVHPFQFTTSIASLATEAGTSIIFGSVTKIDYTAEQGVKSVVYEDKETKNIRTIEATDVIISAGPWTSRIFPPAPITALRAHSIVIKAEVSPYAVFTDIKLPKDFGKAAKGTGNVTRFVKKVNPEVYARPDGTVYACGEGDSLIPLPKSSDLVECDESRCQEIVDYMGAISTTLHEGEVLIKQACYLPLVVNDEGGPLIGETGIKGLLLAAGHTCWGIQNSCATGKLVSEFVFEGGAKSADIGRLDPRKVLRS
ncbi:hypothetical protein B7494_g5032 [Chlorociboria aeruginascens]|nr:hypothetical protein B7494_g5032 [Chlorociboria aeruginascens]